MTDQEIYDVARAVAPANVMVEVCGIGMRPAWCFAPHEGRYILVAKERQTENHCDSASEIHLSARNDLTPEYVAMITEEQALKHVLKQAGRK